MPSFDPDAFPDPLRTALNHLVRTEQAATAGGHAGEVIVFQVFDVLATTLRLLACLGVAQAREASVDVTLARTTLGSLASTCRELGKVLDEQHERVPGLVAVLAGRGPASGIWEVISGLVADRNRLVHSPSGGALEPAPLLEALAAVLDALAFLKGVSVQTRTGSQSIVRAHTTEGTPIAAGGLEAAILADAKGHELLDLDPLVLAPRDADGVCTPYLLHTLDPAHMVWVDGDGRKIVGALGQPADESATAAPEAVPPVRVAAASWADVAPVVEAPVGPASPSAVESLDESLARAAEPLHSFVGLLRRWLDAPARAHLAARFDAMGYVGNDEARLVEYCLERDLRDILDELFSEPQIHGIARSLGFVPHALEPRNVVARRILDTLKIPVPATPIGLAARRSTVARAAAQLAGASDRSAIRGVIAEACTALERVLMDLVRFHGTVLLGGNLVATLRELGWLQGHQTLARAALGTLFDVLGKIEAACQRAGTPQALRFAELFPGRPALLGLGHAERSLIARTRNAFSHVNDELAALDLARLRSLASELFGSLMPFFDLVERQGIHPRVVAVRESVRDAFGRQFVRAVDEWGHEEKIFTDQVMEPGETYFMHPLTNPVRIFPILIRTGE